MANPSKIQFIIDHIDPLGQGVYKQDEKVYFIPKTLPAETGTAEILKKKKGVHFARLESLDQESEYRTLASCKHYDVCSGCHFQHCSYENELNFKEASFLRMLSRLNTNKQLQIIDAPDRFNYRNRIQLHYNKKIGLLGFLDAQNRIVEVPNCIIANDKVTTKLKELYQGKKWLNLVPKGDPKGHVEIYDHNGETKISWNQSYALGGFTQVYKAMNDKLNDLVNSRAKINDGDIVLDIFGGNGNLTKSLEGKKYILDFYTKPKSEENYFHLDLYSDKALNNFINMSHLRSADWFIVDPPRNGFPLLNKWCKELSPKHLIYVSCHPQTMIRDLKNLENYQLKEAFLLDLFPATFHFEACVVLEKINT